LSKFVAWYLTHPPGVPVLVATDPALAPGTSANICEHLPTNRRLPAHARCAL